MTECQRCSGRAHSAFLCSPCQAHLRNLLAEMPWWLSRLTETAIGQTRMSDNGGRKSAPRKDLDGDKELAACIETLPTNKDDDLEKARKAREKQALAHALATGGINARASELLAQIADSLGYWCRVLCEERGLDYRPPVIAHRPVALGQNHAEWLRANVAAIAASEAAADIADDIDTHAEDIVTTVNRPIRTLPLGNCPTWDEERQRHCDKPLRAPEGSVEVWCKRCSRTHNVGLLLTARRQEFEATPHTWPEIKRYNAGQPAEWRVPLRTLQHWRQFGQLTVRGWLRPDGHRGIARRGEDDEPLFLWSDVQKLLVAKPQKAGTGAAAHRRVKVGS